MCGIAGIIGFDLSDKIAIVDLKKMTDLVVHRGPDGEGHLLYKNVGFGHRRLAIIDLSNDGLQPMEYDDIAITFNGEIYNYLELKKELIGLGCRFRTNTDTEVIIQAYKAWGVKCVERFNGMWAFAIIDKRKDVVFISRDRFGIKPLYYYQSKNKFYFGSEIKQILPFIREIKVNKQILFDFIYTSYQNHSSDTFFDEVKKLLPGRNLIYNCKSREYKIEKYYDISQRDKNNQFNTFEEASSAFVNQFKNSIALRLRSDVKVGTCLSGGLDSSFITKLASENYDNKEPFTAITAKSSDKLNDESHLAKIVADKYNLNWKVTEPKKDDFLNSLDEIVYYQEEPFGSPSIVMQYFVMKKAKEEGCVVMLDGQGGDETLLGYERYFIPYLKSVRNPIKRIKAFRLLSNNSKLSFKQLIYYYIYFGIPGIRSRYSKRKHSYILDVNRKYFNKELSNAFRKSSKNLFEMQKKELSDLQLPKLLNFEDKNSMAHSIEARVPFIDHELVELAINISPNYKIKYGWSKFILRKSYGKDAPKEIVWRKNKFGFEAPTKKWMQDKSIYVKEIMNSEFLDNVIKKDSKIQNLDISTIWKLFSIAKWAKTFDVMYN